jgi:hypothetical protein
LAAGALVPLAGAVIHRPVIFQRPAIWVLFGSQAAFVLAFLPGVRRLLDDVRRRLPTQQLLEKHFHHQADGAVLLAYALLVCGIRLALAPTLLFPWGRPDLLVPVTPALLAPLLALRQRRGRSVAVLGLKLSSVCAAGALAWIGFMGLSGLTQRDYPLLIPPSEMRAAVDWIAARHLAQGGGSTIDVGYDLARGSEWVSQPEWCGLARWYSIGRSYDWLLWRRYGLLNVREGSCARLGGTGWQLGNAEPGSHESTLTIVQTFPHLVIRHR